MATLLLYLSTQFVSLEPYFAAYSIRFNHSEVKIVGKGQNKDGDPSVSIRVGYRNNDDAKQLLPFNLRVESDFDALIRTCVVQ